ncbi:galactose-binding domain-like protein [Tuber indicum]|nr:galactose-binding domain-like protein [Tuber indicum]
MALALPLSYNPHTSHLPALLTILPLQQPFLRSRHRCLPPQFTAQTNLKPKRFSGPLALAESIDTVAKVSILTWDTLDLSSTDLGGQVLGFSDEWFDAADNLINPAPPVCKPGVFVPTSVWYYGWEARRRGKAPADWVIIKLGVPSDKVHGFVIGIACFTETTLHRI